MKLQTILYVVLYFKWTWHRKRHSSISKSLPNVRCDYIFSHIITKIAAMQCKILSTNINYETHSWSSKTKLLNSHLKKLFLYPRRISSFSCQIFDCKTFLKNQTYTSDEKWKFYKQIKNKIIVSWSKASTNL